MEGSIEDQRISELAAAFLQKLQQAEALPKGIGESERDGESPDLYSLFSALSALQQEVALQGRSFSKLDQNLALAIQYFETLQSMNENVLQFNRNMHQVQASIDSVSASAWSEVRSAGKEEARREQFDRLIEPLLDTHDQMRRLGEQYLVRMADTHGLQKWFGKQQALQDVQQTCSICEAKLRHKLETLKVKPIAKAGEAFDPKTMQAVEQEYQANQNPGIILEIYRQGYTLEEPAEERVLRFAEVKVTGRKENVK